MKNIFIAICTSFSLQAIVAQTPDMPPTTPKPKADMGTQKALITTDSSSLRKPNNGTKYGTNSPSNEGNQKAATQNIDGSNVPANTNQKNKTLKTPTDGVPKQDN